MLPSEGRRPRGEAVKACFRLCPPHSWCSKETLAGLKLFSPRPSPLAIPPPLSLPSITPDCIWQMPLLAPYHQVWRRQPKTILLCPYTATVPPPRRRRRRPLPFCMADTLASAKVQRGPRLVSMERLRDSQVHLAKRSELIRHGCQRHC